MPDADASVREHLIWQLTGGQAHAPLSAVVADFPMDQINTKFPNGEYGAWALLEHIRRGQWDILDFIRNPGYVYLKWPDDYWPDRDYVATKEDWDKTLAGFEADSQSLQDIVSDPATDLYAKIAHGEGQTIMREILLVVDHNAYHLGELAIMRQVMANWGASHDSTPAL
jgi:hypothetical protein